MKGVLFLLRVAAGALFIASGFTKLIEPYQNFLAVIHSYKIVGGELAKSAAMGLPWAELILGVFLLKGLWVRLSAGALWLMNTAFFAVVASAVIRKLPIEDCGCFGESPVTLTLKQVLGLDAILWVILGILFLKAADASVWSIDRYFERK